MITINETKYATADEVYASESFNALSESEKAISNQYRTQYTKPFAKFLAIDGAELLYESNSKWDGWSWVPCILYNGIIMVPSASMYDLEYNDTITIGFLPVNYIAGNVSDAVCHQPDVMKIYNDQPKKVRVPTAKKLSQWADWCKRYADAKEHANIEINERIKANQEMLRKIEGIEEYDCGYYFKVVRNGLKCTIKIREDGHIMKSIREDYETCHSYFEDIKEA